MLPIKDIIGYPGKKDFVYYLVRKALIFYLNALREKNIHLVDAENPTCSSGWFLIQLC